MLSVMLGQLLVAPAFAAAHYLTVINDSDTDLSQVETAEPNTDRWTPLIQSVIPGGRQGEATVAVPSTLCVWDIRLAAADRPPLTIRGWNICRQPVLYAGKAYRQARLNTEAAGT